MMIAILGDYVPILMGAAFAYRLGFDADYGCIILNHLCLNT